MPTKGFFIDWDGNTRCVEAPGNGYSCNVSSKEGHLSVEVISPGGFVCHEADFYPTIAALESAGVTVNLI